MDIERRFESIVKAKEWKRQLNLSFSTARYSIRLESIAHLPRQTAIVAKHSHLLYKLRYFKTGGGTVEIDGKEFPVESGSFFAVAPFVPHSQIHSESTFADEYTVFIEIIPTEKGKREEQSAVMTDFDRVLDLLVACPYFFGKDSSGAGECLVRMKECLESKSSVSLSSLWVELLSLMIRSVENISPLPTVKVDGGDRAYDVHRLSVLDSVFRTYHEELCAEDVANMLGVSVRQLSRIMMKHYGMSFRQKYALSRMELATTLLTDAESLSVSEISSRLGFGSEGYFSKCFREHFGVSPSEYREKSKRAK